MWLLDGSSIHILFSYFTHNNKSNFWNVKRTHVFCWLFREPNFHQKWHRGILSGNSKTRAIKVNGSTLLSRHHRFLLLRHFLLFWEWYCVVSSFALDIIIRALYLLWFVKIKSSAYYRYGYLFIGWNYTSSFYSSFTDLAALSKSFAIFVLPIRRKYLNDIYIMLPNFAICQI